jgi:hypothetical protein
MYIILLILNYINTEFNMKLTKINIKLITTINFIINVHFD